MKWPWISTYSSSLYFCMLEMRFFTYMSQRSVLAVCFCVGTGLASLLFYSGLVASAIDKIEQLVY